MPLIIYERKKISQNEMIPAAVPNCENDLFKLVYNCLEVGIRSFILFGVPNTRDSKGTGASNSQGIVQRSARRIRDEFGNKVLIITDVCICQYNESGHCGVTNYNNKYVENEVTLRLLSKIAVSHAESGADIVSPSSMMDGQVYRIRRSLNEHILRMSR